MGIDIGGRKLPLALEEGDTEHATVVKDLQARLRDRGLDTLGRCCSSATAPRRFTPA